MLKELMAWAATVVRLPILLDRAGWLAQDILDFPAQFLLFSPHVGSLVLEDRKGGIVREIKQSRHGPDLLLDEPGSRERWRVFDTEHHPSGEALDDAGELARRETVPVVWAVPLTRGRLRRGRFWAFFPTEYETTLSGIINAPWKTNEDRQNLLRGAFNDELLRCVAELVVESIPNLVKDDDPGWYLDVLPARGRESPSWADELITEEVYKLATRCPSLPDQSGELQLPEDVYLHPEDLSQTTVDTWASHPCRPMDWCHPSVNTRDRYSRALRLIEASGREPEDVVIWLEDLVDEDHPEPGASIAALKTAARVLEEDSQHLADGARRAEIILTKRLTFESADSQRVFLPSDYEVRDADLTFVLGDVVENAEARSALTSLGVGRIDVKTEIRARFAGGSVSDWSDDQWESLWALTRQLPPSDAADLIEGAVAESDLYGNGGLRVRTASGQYEPLGHLLLPGPVVPVDGSRDDRVAVDTAFHREDIDLLSRLGAADSPILGTDPPGEEWFWEYKEAAVESFRNHHGARGSRPQPQYVKVRGEDCLRPFGPLTHLSEEGKVEFTRAALRAMGDAAEWSIFHESQSWKYPERQFPNPAVWQLRRVGWVETSRWYIPISESVGPTLESLEQVLPMAEISDVDAGLLGLPATLEEVPLSVWEAAFEEAEEFYDDYRPGLLYGAASHVQKPPEGLRCRVGDDFEDLSPGDVTVVEDERQLRALRGAGIPILLVKDPDHRDSLVRNWGLRPAHSAVTTSPRYVPVGPEILLAEEFPAFKWSCGDDIGKVKLVRCASLILETMTADERRSEDVDFYVLNDTCLASQTLEPNELLAHVDRRLDLGLSPEETEHILENRARKRQDNLVLRIRGCADDAERVAAAIGGEAIRAGMPPALVEAVERLTGRGMDDRTLGKLVLAIYGVGVLKEFKEAQEEHGLSPPTTWAGSSRAVQYVRDLGFPIEYAGRERERRPAHELIDGPRELPRLHDYQRAIADRVKALISRSSDRRGMLSLPTGAGKTRVAVEALIEALIEGTLAGPLLWVAQSDELCEQAVQAWTEVWRNAGPRHQVMISRLWTANEAAPFTGGTHVVVATIAKLGVCIEDSEYDWLKAAQCLVIDEAHGSTQPSYTRLLDWVGLGRGRGDEKCALIGLTATPFRGVSVEETKRLVSRYGRTRLDLEAMGQVTYRDLQDMDVLARVDHQLIEGVSITLTENELRDLQRTRLLPAAALNKVGGDPDRNLALLRSIQELPDDWPVLLFAASVDHARTMAALLASQGISAGAISGETEPDTRRHYVDRFRSGTLRVLTNYQVLTQGFDAPSVRALYIARPTYSPNLYQQMVGRGLRGTKNGGKPRCLIVNVRDNVEQYGEKLAFNEFDYLWSGGENGVD